MASRRRPTTRVLRDRRPARRTNRRGRGRGWFWFLGFCLLVGGGGAFWLARRPGARPVPTQPTPKLAGPVTPVTPGATSAIPITPEVPRVRVATNLVRVPPSAQGLTNGLGTNRVAGSSPGRATNAVVPGRDLTPPAGRPVRDPFEAQVALSRRGYSCGSLDGSLGIQTRAALRTFQQLEGLAPTGHLDAATRDRLRLEEEPHDWFVVTQFDLDRLQPVPATWLGKSAVDYLGFETILEQAAEIGHAHPALIRKLNPSLDWTQVTPGTSIRVPRAAYPTPRSRASLIRISLTEKTLRAFDSDGVLLCFFPCSIAQKVEKRPVGDLRVEVSIQNPDYTFNPEIFPESAEAREIKRKLVLPHGPNNPVGVAWIGLSRPGYGIHGTPKPEDVGRTESHGCFRLANWNAEYLRQLVTVGTPVSVEP